MEQCAMHCKMQQADGDAEKATSRPDKPCKSKCRPVLRTQLHPFFCPRNQTMQAYAADAGNFFNMGDYP